MDLVIEMYIGTPGCTHVHLRGRGLIVIDPTAELVKTLTPASSAIPRSVPVRMRSYNGRLTV